jgi:hypothetical protein
MPSEGASKREFGMGNEECGMESGIWNLEFDDDQVKS